jgi:hypothetical protein
MKIILMAFLLTACSVEFKEGIRPDLTNLLGEDLANALLGPPPPEVKKKEIVLPPIPKVVQDATSTKQLDRLENLNMDHFKGSKLRDLNVQFIRELYEVVKNQDVDQAHLSEWINVLDQGGSREGVYRALVDEESQLKKESKPLPLTDRTIDFVDHFSHVYLDRSFSKGDLEKMNFFQLKRLLTDYALEVMDAFSEKINDLYDWYAVLSADIAQNFSFAFRSHLRKNPSKEFHRVWAQNVPIQMIKSEVIIKIQRVLNSLNK